MSMKISQNCHCLLTLSDNEMFKTLQLFNLKNRDM